MLVAKVLIVTILVVGGGYAIWRYANRHKSREDGTPFAARDQHPVVTDRAGTRYTQSGMDGWVPEGQSDDPGVHPMTFQSLTQNVEGGELHIDHRNERDETTAAGE